MRLRSLFTLCLLLSPVACRSLNRFDTHGDAAYCGDLVFAPDFEDGFVAADQAPDIRLKLKLDVSQLSSFSENRAPITGSLTSNDSAHGLCSDSGDALFQSAPLRAIPQVYHDALSTLSFGEGHDDDFFAWADSTCQGTMLTLVSLLRNGDVEVRLFKPAPLPAGDAGPNQRPGFAVFSLQRDEGGCDF
jgi:hypothetical protein